MKTKFLALFVAFLLSLYLPHTLHAQCSSSTAELSPSTTCNTITASLFNVASSALTASCTGAATTYSVWYRFTATTGTSIITVTPSGNNLNASTTYLQVFNTSCATANSVYCQNVNNAAEVSTVIGNTYYLRIFVTTNPTAGNTNGWRFTVCVQTPAANDECSGAINLTSNTNCSNTTGNLNYASPSAGIPTGCEAGTTYYDMWYKFTATNTAQQITLSSLGSNITNPSIQLFSGTCNSALTLLACGTTSVYGKNLTKNAVYFIRVSNRNVAPTGSTNNGFSICVILGTSIDYSRNYINVTKGSSGGTIDPGDTLEMRLTFVVSSKTADSLSFYDTLYSGKGLRLVPGSLALRTNEGKVYKSYTDAADTDAGWYTPSGSDTIIRIHFGTGSSSTARGSLANTSRPSVFGATCIIMATYRVVVYATYNEKINYKSGRLTYRDPVDLSMNTISFDPNFAMVYMSPGLCPNAVSATNALGAESNGTFGSPAGSLPHARNRAASPFTSYTYALFDGGGPGDYFYGIANNTSATYTTVQTLNKPDATGGRVFSQWDITGDHTGATDLEKGNLPCNINQPISATNPCGYMLVINSAYRADTAFTYTVTNLCPNTYYELSAWFKNICYKCGSDSTGAGSGTVGYIPTATGDSSGVYPNIAFDVNGTDYYTTGNIRYLGTTPTGSDANNKWVKRGFVYLTGANETSFTLTLRNNAPGGGGNDWALDDISVATCLPNMQYSPTMNPTVCQTNAITINDTIRSYFNNYTNFKWQRSTDNGSTWLDVSGTSGSAIPEYKNGQWEYITSYTIPPANTTSSNHRDRYRVVVATTAGNVTNTDCQVTDGISLIDLNVINCTSLNTKFLMVNGLVNDGLGKLSWKTSKEYENIIYEIERSNDGMNFKKIKDVPGYNINGAEANFYQYTDSGFTAPKAYYRIALKTGSGKKYFSDVIELKERKDDFKLLTLTNPFNSQIQLEVNSSQDRKADLILMNASGLIMRQQYLVLSQGITNISIGHLDELPKGVYILQLQDKDQSITRKLIKQ